MGKEILSGYRIPGLRYRLVFQATFTQTHSKQVPTTHERDVEEAWGYGIQG